MWVLGIDASSTGVGFCRLPIDEEYGPEVTWFGAVGEPLGRVVALGRQASERYRAMVWHYGDPLAVAIEAPFFRGPASATLAMAQGAVLAGLNLPLARKHVPPVFSYAPQEVRAEWRVLPVRRGAGEWGESNKPDAWLHLPRAAAKAIGDWVANEWPDPTCKAARGAAGDMADAFFVAHRLRRTINDEAKP